MSIRRNCDNLTDFHIQSEVLTNRFCEKSYSQENLIKTKNQVLTMDRAVLLNTKKKTPFQGDLAFVSDFHRPYRSVENT